MLVNVTTTDGIYTFGPDGLAYFGGSVFGPDTTLSVQVAGIAPILSIAPAEVVFAIPFSTPDGDAIPVTVPPLDLSPVLTIGAVNENLPSIWMR